MAFILVLLLTYVAYGFFSKKYKSLLLCLVLSYLSSALIVSFLTVSVCSDGWGSMSIGLQGACSHHGGVTTKLNGLGILIFVGCIIYVFKKYRQARNSININTNESFISEIVRNPNENSFVYRTTSRQEEQKIKDKCYSNKITYKLKHEVYKNNFIAHFEFINDNDLNTAIDINILN